MKGAGGGFTKDKRNPNYSTTNEQNE